MDLLGDYRTEIDKIDKEMTKLLETVGESKLVQLENTLEPKFDKF